MNSTFHYVDGVCGSGKTYAAVREIADLVKAGTSVIYATSTKILLKQTQEDFDDLGVQTHLMISPDVQSDTAKQSSVVRKL